MDRRSRDINIVGEKVVLNRFAADDICWEYIEWLNDPVVVRFSNQRFIDHDKNSCLSYLASFEKSENLFLGIRDLADGRLVGTMTAYRSSTSSSVDVGIMVGDKSVWGLGYGQDAWNTLTNWLLDRDYISKVTAGTLASNLGMIKLAERSGMTLDSQRESQQVVEGQKMSVIFYEKFSAS
jgi:RimJ/RimL family protein N-acetyltransferase